MQGAKKDSHLSVSQTKVNRKSVGKIVLREKGSCIRDFCLKYCNQFGLGLFEFGDQLCTISIDCVEQFYAAN